MADGNNKAGLAVQTPGESNDYDQDRNDAEQSIRSIAATEPARGGSPFEVYKSGQGTYVRFGTALGASCLALGFIYFVYEQMAAFTFSQSTMTILRTSVTAVLLAGLAWLIFYLVGQRRNVVDFLIATEGEMKKVNWSSRKEVLGATKVVIVTVLALGMMLFVVDILFILFFVGIKVLRIDILSGLLGRGQ